MKWKWAAILLLAFLVDRCSGDDQYMGQSASGIYRYATVTTDNDICSSVGV